MTDRGASRAIPSGAGKSGRNGSDVVRAQFKTREVVELLDLSRRQLQYWAKTGLIEPSERTPGGHHRYSFDDLVALKATKRLIDAGVSVQKIRASVGALQRLLPQVGRPLSELVLVATGDVVLVFQEHTVFEAVSGQEWVFEVADFEREVSAYRSVGRSTERAATSLGRRNGPDHETRNGACARQDFSTDRVSRPTAQPSHHADAGHADAGQESSYATQETTRKGNDKASQDAMPARPGPRGTRGASKSLSRTG